MATLLAGAPAPLALCPQTASRTEALDWVTGRAAAGVEGVVAKGADSRYLPGRRGWLKYRHTWTTEAVIGGVTGSRGHPETVLLGRYDLAGRLRYVGQSRPLNSWQRARADRVSRGPARPAWAPVAAAGRLGQLHRPEPPAYRQIAPCLVAEISVDTAFEHQRWRHRVRYLRVRADLSACQVPRLTS